MIKLFTIKFDRSLEKFDDNEFQNYIKDKDVLSVENHFFICRETPYVLFIVDCQFADTTSTADLTVKPASRNRKSAVPSFLKESELPLYNSLKDWRNQYCQKKGIPPYVICNNDQLGKMVSLRPNNLADLAKIEGLGENKVKKYGVEILQVLSKMNGASPIKPVSNEKKELNTEKQTGKSASNEPNKKT